MNVRRPTSGVGCLIWSACRRGRAGLGQGETYAQPSGVVTPKKQSPLVAWMTWFLKTGVMTTPAETMEAAAAMTRAKAVFILDGWAITDNVVKRRGREITGFSDQLLFGTDQDWQGRSGGI